MKTELLMFGVYSIHVPKHYGYSYLFCDRCPKTHSSDRHDNLQP
ncbi:MAG TPA: hypothetical protein V6C57_01060 [Coleofasciculaceae cyanobacterium]